MNLTVKDKKQKQIANKQIGLFFEDINYGLDGGLHAELLENRNFEFKKIKGSDKVYIAEDDCLYAWHFDENNKGCLSIETEEPLVECAPHYLRVSSKNSTEFYNFPYDGIVLQKGKKYKITFVARAKDFDGTVEINTCTDTKCIHMASFKITKSDRWALYETMGKVASDDLEKGKFLVSVQGDGVIEFNAFSMIPEDAVLGLFRRDLAEILKEVHPAFLRFPGGCVVEGATWDSRYDWKDGIGEWYKRKNNWNRWAVHDNSCPTGEKRRYSNYNQSMGVGFYEYFVLCEYLGAAPVPILNVGLACQFQTDEKVSVESEEFRNLMQDALDLIEFANGSVTSKWGSIRAEMGHPIPFGLTMLGIGNEQWETVEVDYFERYRRFEKVIHEQYPEMKLIGSAGPDVLEERYNMAWEFYYEEKKKNPNFVYAIDEHYYKNPDWFYDNLHFYDDYKRDIAVFAGEYAAHHDNGMNRPELNDWSAALAEASYMIGLEKNGDLVVMAAYAPLLARLGYTQWSPDLIWFDDKDSYGSPSYYVQKLYGQTQGDVLLNTEQDGEECLISVSEDTENKNVYIKLIQPKNAACKVQILFDFDVEENATVLEIVGEPSAVNTIAKPRTICLEEREIKISKKFEYEVKPYSAQCICIKR